MLKVVINNISLLLLFNNKRKKTKGIGRRRPGDLGFRGGATWMVAKSFARLAVFVLLARVSVCLLLAKTSPSLKV